MLPSAAHGGSGRRAGHADGDPVLHGHPVEDAGHAGLVAVLRVLDVDCVELLAEAALLSQQVLCLLRGILEDRDRIGQLLLCGVLERAAATVNGCAGEAKDLSEPRAPARSLAAEVARHGLLGQFLGHFGPLDEKRPDRPGLVGGGLLAGRALVFYQVSQI